MDEAKKVEQGAPQAARRTVKAAGRCQACTQHGESVQEATVIEVAFGILLLRICPGCTRRLLEALAAQDEVETPGLGWRRGESADLGRCSACRSAGEVAEMRLDSVTARVCPHCEVALAAALRAELRRAPRPY